MQFAYPRCGACSVLRAEAPDTPSLFLGRDLNVSDRHTRGCGLGYKSRLETRFIERRRMSGEKAGEGADCSSYSDNPGRRKVPNWDLNTNATWPTYDA